MDNIYKKMTIVELNQCVLTHIGLLEQQGMVDNCFRECHSLKEYSEHSFFADLITNFVFDTQIICSGMENALNQENADFKKMSALCMKLTGSSGCFGARKISKACSNLRVSIDYTSKYECLMGLAVLNHEYSMLRDQLDAIYKVEKEIVSRAPQGGSDSISWPL